MGNKKRTESEIGEISFEATISDARLHNSKLADESWVDLTVRVLGEAGITAVMNTHRAKNKIVKIIYQLEK